jgi:hypothetical protein
MPRGRRAQRGNFGGRVDELVKHFTEHQPEQPGAQAHERSSELQEKIDIHARLFELAWELERGDMDGSGI